MWNLPLLVNLEIPGFSWCQRFIFLFFMWCLVSFMCIEILLLFYVNSPCTGGGVHFLTFILLVQRVLVLSSGQFFTEWRTVFSVIEFRNSLHRLGLGLGFFTEWRTVFSVIEFRNSLQSGELYLVLLNLEILCIG